LISDHYISHDLSVVEYIASRVEVMVEVEETFIIWFEVDGNRNRLTRSDPFESLKISYDNLKAMGLH